MAKQKTSQTLAELLAVNVRMRRAELNLSQGELALECEMDRTFVGHIERGARNVSIGTIEKLAKGLGVEPYQLLMPVERRK